jgi:hypothetical protein
LEAIGSRSTPRSSFWGKSSSPSKTTPFERRYSRRVFGSRTTLESCQVRSNHLACPLSERLGSRIFSRLTTGGDGHLRDYEIMHRDRLQLLQILIENEMARLSVWQNALGEAGRAHAAGTDRSTVSRLSSITLTLVTNAEIPPPFQLPPRRPSGPKSYKQRGGRTPPSLFTSPSGSMTPRSRSRSSRSFELDQRTSSMCTRRSTSFLVIGWTLDRRGILRCVPRR